MMSVYKKTIIVSAIVLMSVFVYALPLHAAQNSFPKKANYFLHWTLTSSKVSQLARWDLLVLDMENQTANPDLLRRLRQLNPDIVLLAYITPQEIITNASNSSSQMRRSFASGIKNDWYLYDSGGSKLSWWSGTYLLNVTQSSLTDYMSSFVADEILDSGLWDGVFYDNAWETIGWALNNKDLDIDRDGQNDYYTAVDAKWRQGLNDLYKKTRSKTNSSHIIVGNGITKAYADNLNGIMLENFSGSEWERFMQAYEYNNDRGHNDTINIVNSNTSNSGNQNDYQKMRFGFTSTLLEDGYFSFDHGDQDHGQTWWYDEYDVDLGNPISKSTSKQSYSTYKEDVWRRNFENGISIVNSTGSNQTIDLGGEYEKIHGAQDARINDGAIVSEVSVPSEDGLVLLKTFETLNDLVFTNGAFLRFFRMDGSRVRNGFFAFEDGEKGGTQIIHIDINNNGKRDLVIARRNKIMAWRDDGQLYMKVYPYGGRYTGNLVLAVGDLNGDRKMEIYVAPTEGHAEPIRVYTRHGRKMRKDFYPFGQSYTGGYTLAIGDTDPVINSNQLFIGSLSGRPSVSVFSYRFDQLYKWDAFESWFTGGVYVAAGDVDGDGIDEVVTGKGVGGKPLVKIFDITGKLKYPEFAAYSSFGTPGIDVRVVDVDFDGREDIVGVSEGAF